MKKKLCCKARYNPSLGKAIWFVSTCRNALVVLLGCVIAYAFELYGYHPFSLTGNLFSVLSNRGKFYLNKKSNKIDFEKFYK